MKKIWTKKEINYLKENYLTKSNIELSKLLKCKPTSISNKLIKLNLHRPKEGNSNRMKMDNPMYNKESIKKMMQTQINMGYKPLREYNIGKSRPDITLRNKINNPMKNPEIAKRVGKILRNKYKSGEIISPFKGIHRIWKNGHPKGMKNKHHSEKTKKQIAITMSGKNNHFYGKHHSEYTKNILKIKSHETGLKRFDSKEKKEDFNKKMLNAQHKRPTKPEKIMIRIIEENNLPFKYVGNGELCIGGFFPDFINEEKKIILEINGSYWHNLSKIIEKDNKKYDEYKRQGYEFIIVWDYELKDKNDVLNRINKLLKI